jgi:hypothetical protein
MNRTALARLTLLLAAFVSLALGQKAKESLESQDATAPENADAIRMNRVTGRVVDDVTGSPLSGVTVRLQTVIMHANCMNCSPTLPPLPEPPPAEEVATGTDGLFAFDNVPASNVSITAKKAGYIDAWPLHRHAIT